MFIHLQLEHANHNHSIIELILSPFINGCSLFFFNFYLESDFTGSPSFNGSSYLQYPGLAQTALSFIEIQIVFKPKSSNGILLYNGNRMDGKGDFISLNLVDGFIEFRFDLGTGPAIIRYFTC